MSLLDHSHLKSLTGLIASAQVAAAPEANTFVAEGVDVDLEAVAEVTGEPDIAVLLELAADGSIAAATAAQTAIETGLSVDAEALAQVTGTPDLAVLGALIASGKIEAATAAATAIESGLSVDAEAIAEVTGTPDLNLVLQLLAEGRVDAATQAATTLEGGLSIDAEAIAEVTGSVELAVLGQLLAAGRVDAATQAATTLEGGLSIDAEALAEVTGTPDLNLVLQLLAEGRVEAATAAATTLEGGLSVDAEAIAEVTGTPDLNLVLQLLAEGRVEAATAAATTLEGGLSVDAEAIAEVTGTPALNVILELLAEGRVAAATEAATTIETGIAVDAEAIAQVTGTTDRSVGVLTGKTVDAIWDDRSVDYTDLADVEQVTCRIKCTITPGDTGLLMESGGSVDGMALYVANGGTLGTERLVLLAGDGSGGSSTADTAKVEHQLNRRFDGASTSGDDTILATGDKRGLVEVGETILLDNVGDNTYDVLSVTYDSANDETQIELSGTPFALTSTADWVIEGEREVVISWSAYSRTAATLYVNGVPVGQDRIDNSILAGGNEGTIGGIGGGSVRDLDVSWSGSDYDFDGSIREATIAVGETTDEVFIDTLEKNLGSPTAIWEDESATFTELTSISNASGKAFALIDDTLTTSRSQAGVLMESGASGDGLALYMNGDTLIFKAGEGGSTGGDFNTIELQYTLPGPGAYIIEWTARTDTGAKLWVNGSLVASDTSFSYSGELAGTNEGCFDFLNTAIAANRAGYSSPQPFYFGCERAEVWTDDALSTGPDLSGGQTNTFSYDSGTGTASHQAGWSGGAANFQFVIYETSSKSNAIYQTTSSDRSDSDSGYSSPDPGFSVFFEVTDANNEVDTQEVFLSG